MVEGMEKDENELQKALGNSLWGISRMGHCPPANLLGSLGELFRASLLRLSEEDSQKEESRASQRSTTMMMGNTLVSLVKLGYQPSEDMVHLLRRVILKLLPDFHDNTLVMVIWSMNKVERSSDPAFKQAIDARIEDRIRSLSKGTLAHLLSIYANNRHELSQEFVTGAMQAIEDKLDSFAHIDLAIVLHAMAMRNFQPPEALAHHLKAALIQHLGSPSIKDQHVSMIMWALARLDLRLTSEGRVDCNLMEHTERVILRLTQRRLLTGLSLSICMWAYARIGYNPSRWVLSAAAASLKEQLKGKNLQLQSLAQLMWAFSSLRWYDKELFGMVGSLLHQRLMDTRDSRAMGRELRQSEGMWLDDVRQYNQLLVSFAQFGHRAPVLVPLVEDLLEKMEVGWLESQTERTRYQVLVNCLWALAMLDLLNEPVAGRIMGLLWDRTVEDARVVERVLPQLYHVHLISRLRPGAPLQLPPHLSQLAKEAWHRECLKTTTSEYQISIFRALVKICPDAKMEDTAKGGLFSIDMTLRDARGRLVAVEADGPMHFTSSTPHRPLHAYGIRNDLLRLDGYIVVNIPYYDWYYKLQGDEEQQLAYLRSALAERGVELG